METIVSVQVRFGENGNGRDGLDVELSISELD